VGTLADLRRKAQALRPQGNSVTCAARAGTKVTDHAPTDKIVIAP
jgi:hypothetical protein